MLDPSRRTWLGLCLVALLTLSALAWTVRTPIAQAAPGQTQALTNDDLLEMHRLGLGSSVLLTALRHHPTAFDTGPEALAALERSGISPSVLDAVRQTASRPL